MNCKNCGAQLTGTEAVCPSCGNPVENAAQTPAVDNTVATPEAPVAQPTAQPEAAPTVAEAQPAVAPVTPEVAPAVVPGNTVQGGEQMTPVAQEATPTQQPPKKSNITLILILVLVVVVIIGAVVFFILFNKPADDNGTRVDNNVPPTDVSTNTKTNAEYGGYVFEVPDGMEAEESDDLGLVIFDDSIAYSFNVDYSNSFDKYLAAFQQKFPDQADKVKVTLYNRDYLVVNLYDETDQNTIYTMYITSSGESSVILGMVIRRDFTAAQQADFKVLTEIIDGATKGTTSFAAGDPEDAGKDGIKEFKIDKSKIKFAEKED